MSVLSQPAYSAHASVFHHGGLAPVPINCPCARFPGLATIRVTQRITVNHAATLQSQRCSIQLPRECPLSSSIYTTVTQESARGILALCVRGKFSQLARGNRGLMVVKGLKQQKIFQELRTVCHGPGENLPNFKDICDGTFPDPMHEGVHEERGTFLLHHGKIVPICQIPAAV
ncbi:hypothetical protein TNCV_2271871 [Trichonephila clavipes]|nr:hypothetical protein TNCV_2271871 [Trichonephila clavipes]